MGDLTNPVAIIQARMGSSRLPGKVLMEVSRRPMLQRVIERVQRAELPKQVVVAAPMLARDVPIVNLCVEMEVLCFVGSEQDVLDRYYQCAKMFKADPIVRITSDCPLVDPDVIDGAIELYAMANWQYVNTFFQPDGLDCEVFSFKVLEDAWSNAKEPYDREHVTPYIKGHTLGAGLVDGYFDQRHLHWSVDTLEDLEFVRWVYRILGDDFRLNDIIKLLKRKGGEWKSRLNPAQDS